MQKHRLLLLEDQEMDAAFIQKVLQRSGMNFEMVRVDCKKDFLSAIQDFTYDAILADNHLPDFDALTALELMKEHNVTTPVILVTGTASEEFAVNIMKAGACDYILKDRLQRLPNAVISAIKKHELEIEQQQYLENIIKNEALLKESERLAHMGSWEADLMTGETIWSDEIFRILDYSPGVVLPNLENFVSKVHPDDIDVVKKEINHALSNGTDVRLDCRIVKSNGQPAYLENNLFVTKDETGKAVRAYGFSIDVTERKLAEELLQKSEANLKTIFDNTETGYALLDRNCYVVSFNQPIYRFSQRQLAKPIRVGEDFLDFCTPDRRPVVAAVLDDALNGIASRYEMPYAQPDGTDQWFYVTYSPVTNEDKRVIGIIVSETDITKRKLLELQEKIITEDLIQRNKALEQFAYIVSHNLRGPMTTIMGISNLMNDENVTDEDKEFFMTGITETVKKLDNVVMDLVSILQFKNSGNENREPVYFDQVINDVASVITPTTDNDTDLTIKTDFSAVDSIVTLKSYIHSIFYNLISNSIKYKRPEMAPCIEISSKRTANKIELYFKDNGMGMDLEKMGDQVFGLYKRFHVNSAEGKGMGLFMVKTQVETLGGKISVKSKINEGTEFRIEFFSSN